MDLQASAVLRKGLHPQRGQGEYVMSGELVGKETEIRVERWMLSSFTVLWLVVLMSQMKNSERQTGRKTFKKQERGNIQKNAGRRTGRGE